MLNPDAQNVLDQLQPGRDIGTSPWVAVTQEMIDRFGEVTLDPDPMHVDPEWARHNGPYGGTIAFGFLTVSLLTHLLHAALGTGPHRESHRQGYYLNYGFDRLRLVAPVRTGKRIRGHFTVAGREVDEQQRLKTTISCRVEIEGDERPALIADWLTYWVPPEA